MSEGVGKLRKSMFVPTSENNLCSIILVIIRVGPKVKPLQVRSGLVLFLLVFISSEGANDQMSIFEGELVVREHHEHQGKNRHKAVRAISVFDLVNASGWVDRDITFDAPAYEGGKAAPYWCDVLWADIFNGRAVAPTLPVTLLTFVQLMFL